MTNRSNGLIKNDMIYGHQHQLKRYTDIMLFCLVLGEKFSDRFGISINTEITVSAVQDFIKGKKENTLKNIDANNLNLWKVAIPTKTKNNKRTILESQPHDQIDIEKDLEGVLLEADDNIDDLFDQQPEIKQISILVQPPSPTTAGPSQQGTVDWNNVDSVYNWIKSLKRPLEAVASKLVSSTSGANFPLQGREETMKILMEGNGGRNGICKRFTNRNESDRNNHPIPLLANGPGTGKSRFLQEIPTLLRERAEKLLSEQAKEYTNDNELLHESTYEQAELSRVKEYMSDGELLELLNRIKDRMYAINVTFGNGTPASYNDASIGQTSVALRILYEHFVCGGTYDYDEFIEKCGKNYGITISIALRVVLKDVKDVDADKDFIVLGIDELNLLHGKRGQNNPVREIIHAVGGLNCSGGNIFHVSILSGTIQGPFQEIFRDSTYLYLYLPLRLLKDQEVWNISESVAHSERNSNLRDYINRSTFHRCISDFGGHVRALDLFYEELLKQIAKETGKVNYIDVMSSVMEDLRKRYPFMESSAITPALAHAILNIPVKEEDKVENLTYVDLSSQGILNLESAFKNLFYVRMPYVWVWILTSYNNQSCKFWDVMIDQKSHVLWQEFEDFNMRFWALRLRLLSELNRSVTIKDIFRGAFFLDEFDFLEHEKSEFELPDTSSIKCQELKHQYPQTVQREHLAPGTIYKNCEGAESWDVFFFLDGFLFAIQIKSSKAPANNPQKLNKNMIRKEYKKTEEAFKLLKKQVPGIKDWMLLICTNGCKTEDALDELSDNCLAVCSENIDDFYGYTFSSRAEFCAANDRLDANSAEEFELNTVKNIRLSTARKIIAKRPYDDEDDLYHKVKINEQAKKRIKVVKNIN